MKIDWKNGLIVLLLFLCGFLFLSRIAAKNQAKKLDRQYRNEILRTDSVKQVYDGLYQKYVAQYSEAQMASVLKDSCLQLWKIIRKQDEKIKLNAGVVLSLNNKIDSLSKVSVIYVVEKDSVFPKYTFTARYPDPESAFITYNGSIFKNQLSGSWVFGKLSLGLTVVETKPGIWKSYLRGPDWISVQDIQVQSAIKETKTPFFRLYAGGGYLYFYDGTTGPLISLGLGLKNRFLVSGMVSTKFAGGVLLYGF